jgi:GT2 family glycosyltransferase
MVSRNASTPFVSVIVPVRNGADTVEACMRSILATDWPPEQRELIVVDNGSRDGTAARLGGLPVRLVHEMRRGRSYARNRGIAEARGEIVLFTDVDCTVDRAWITELVSGFDEAEVWGVAGEIRLTPPERLAERYVAERERDHQRFVLSFDPPFAITSNVAYYRKAFAEIGPFDPAFPTAEDVDFGWRFHRAGFRYAYRPNAIVQHRPRATVGALLRQQESFGYGRAILRERYGLKRGYALGTGAELRRASARLLRSLAGREHAATTDLLALEVAVRLALRAGAARYSLVRAASIVSEELAGVADELEQRLGAFRDGAARASRRPFS